MPVLFLIFVGFFLIIVIFFSNLRFFWRSTKKFQDAGDVIEGIQCVLTKLQIGLGDGVEVEVSDHVDEGEENEVVDLELDLEEGELDLACVEHVLRKTGEGVHE